MMSQNNQKAAEFHGINVQPLLDKGARVYKFEQRNAITHTPFPDGLCFGFSTSLMFDLLEGDFSKVQNYQNPIPDTLIAKAINITNSAIDQVRDGNDLESIAFPNRQIKKTLTTVENIPAQLDANTNGAFLVYKQKNGVLHQLLFFNKKSGKCIVQDPNRFTIDDIDIEDGRNLLTAIVSRSNPGSVLVVKDSVQRSRL